MKKVLETYGGAVIAILVISVILLCVLAMFRVGPERGNAISALANESIKGDLDFQATGEAFSEYKERKLPEIIYMEDYEVKSKEYVPVENCFRAISHEGESLAVEVTYIINIHEESEEVQYQNGKACFYFELHGVYKVFVKATDRENNTTYAMVKMPVNKGGLH